MNRVQAYLEKALSGAPPILAGIEEPPSVQIAAGAPVADAISAFLSRYLACEAHQLTVLALWVIYTWCFGHFSTNVYSAFFQRFFAGFSRPTRDEIPIRNVFGKRISCDWRSLSRLRGSRRFFYVPEGESRLLGGARFFCVWQKAFFKGAPLPQAGAERRPAAARKGRVPLATQHFASPPRKGRVAESLSAGLFSAVPLKRDWRSHQRLSAQISGEFSSHLLPVPAFRWS
jgi:hypothetical protein